MLCNHNNDHNKDITGTGKVLKLRCEKHQKHVKINVVKIIPRKTMLMKNDWKNLNC